MAGPGSDLTGQEVTFLLAKTLSGRMGWKIMTEDEELSLRINGKGVEQVMRRIRLAAFITFSSLQLEQSKNKYRYQKDIILEIKDYIYFV